MEIRRISVIGLGLLGRGITACLLANGLDVVVRDHAASMQQDIQAFLADVMLEIAEHRPACATACANWQHHLHWASTLDAFAESDLVIESVSELLPAKRDLLLQLESIVTATTPLASNTSALPITELQRGLRYPQRVLGMHWAEPAFATRFLELIGGEQTSPTILQALDTFARSLGKEPCIVSDLPGFIVNRLAYAMYREAMHLLEMGVADAPTIDRAYRNAAGVWASFCGPFRWIDITGGPALYARAMERILPDLTCTQNVPDVLQKQIELDRTAIASDGSRAATGFYSDTPEQRQLWLNLLHRQAWEVEALRTRMGEAIDKLGLSRKS